MLTQTDIRQQVTDKIVQALQTGKLPPWRKPWTADPNCGAARNFVSDKLYRGINVLILDLSSFRSRWWATYRQWQAAGGQVKRGEKATQIVFFSPIEKWRVNQDTQQEELDRFFLMRFYSIFNLEQVEGEALDQYRPVQSDPGLAVASADWAAADHVVASTGADIRYGGNRACYTPPAGGEWPNHKAGDYISIPARTQFPDVRDFFSTQFHELGHWTCPRMNWHGNYAMGELVAELTSAFVSRQLNLPQSENLDNSASYLASWLKAMADDPKFIFQASAQASKASDFILAFSKQVESEPAAVDAAE